MNSLTPEQSRGQSYDADWSIAQVLSHLGSQAEIFSAWLETAAERSDPPPQEFFQRIWDALIYGRLDPDHTPQLEVTAGDITLDGLRAVFPGV